MARIRTTVIVEVLPSSSPWAAHHTSTPTLKFERTTSTDSGNPLYYGRTFSADSGETTTYFRELLADQFGDIDEVI